MINPSKSTVFPILENQKSLVYLDSGATTLKPAVVVEKMVEYMTQYSANIHRGVYCISERATAEYEAARLKVAQFIGAENKEEIIFTRGTTDSINLVARGWGDNQIVKGDEIAVTEMEHHSDLVPWQQLCLRKGAKLKFIKISINNYQLIINNLREKVNKNSKILALTQVSNVLGTVNPIKEIISEARKINPEITVLVDGAQAVGHMLVDVIDLGTDFYAFSGHKMYGPTGVGVLYGKKEKLAEMEPVEYGGGMIREVNKIDSSWGPIPERFEAGTPAIAEVIGLGAAVDFLESIGREEIRKKELKLANYAQEKLIKVEGLRVFSSWQSGIMSMSLKGVHAHDVASVLDGEGIAVRAGHHCAMPLHQILGETATFRVSLGIENTKEDIDKLVMALEKVKNIFK